MNGKRTIVQILAVAVLITPGAAHAYLDPATGSMILQTVIGGAAAAAVAFKFYWRRIARFIGLGRGDDSESE